MDKFPSLRRWSPILEELNKKPDRFLDFNTLYQNTKLVAPTLTRRIGELAAVGYVDRKGVSSKITETGQRVFAVYKQLMALMGQIP